MTNITASVTRLGNPAAAYFGATGVWRDNPHDLLAFNSKLWIASGDAANNNPPSQSWLPIHVYNPATNTFSEQGDTFASPDHLIQCYEIEHFRVINFGSGDRIVVPNYQPTLNDDLSFFTSDGNGTWTQTRVANYLEEAHTYDVYRFGGRLFATTTARNSSSVQTIFGDDGAGSNTPSTGLGATSTFRPSAFFELDSELWCATQAGYNGFPAFAPVNNNMLWKYNGSTAFSSQSGTTYGSVFPGAATQTVWSQIMRPVNFPDTGTVFYLGVDQPLYTLSGGHDYPVPFGLYKATSLPPSGGSVTAVSLPNSAVPDALLVDGSTLYCLGHRTSGGDTVVSLMATTDGSSWSEVFSFIPANVGGASSYPQAVARSFALLSGIWYFGIGTLSTTSIPSSVGDILAYANNPALTSHGVAIGGLKTTKLLTQGYATRQGNQTHKRRGMTGGIPSLTGGFN